MIAGAEDSLTDGRKKIPGLVHDFWQPNILQGTKGKCPFNINER